MKAYDSIYNRYIKRIIDLILAVSFLIVAIPLYLVIGIRIIAEDRRAMFYRPLRGGYRNKLFGFSSSVPWLRMRTKSVGER